MAQNLPPNVFVSMGTPYTDKQRAFRSALLDTIRSHGMSPRMMNVTDYPPGNPLPHILKLIESCAGTIIVAYERKHVDMGSERRQSPQEQKITDSTYTTPWNHIESALAYSLDKPLLILCERGLKKEGLIEDKSDWYVHELDIDPARLADQDLAGRLTTWRDHIRTHRSRSFGSAIDFADLQGFPFLEIARRLSLGSWAAIVSAITFLLGVGFFFGTLAR